MWLPLIGIGALVGGLGSLVGAGCGILLVPILILGFHLQAPIAAGTSLSTVFVNSVASTTAYHKQRRTDYVSGALFALASVPGAVLGTLAAPYVPEHAFQVVFGGVLAFAAIVMLSRALRPVVVHAAAKREIVAEIERAVPRAWHVVIRRFVDGRGKEHVYAYSVPVVLAIGLGAGILSAILGIGGGIVQVPAMVMLLAFPAHVATATSQVILLFTTSTGAAAHAMQSNINVSYAIPLALGALVGAPSGAFLSRRLDAKWIVALLACVMLVVAVRLVF
ncbi:MAG TPA: sulfite exporter TauE/SafE family protein [Vicinamibacterales bacterium]